MIPNYDHEIEKRYHPENFAEHLEREVIKRVKRDRKNKNGKTKLQQSK